MVNIKINDVPISVEEGTTILEACREAKMIVPTLILLVGWPWILGQYLSQRFAPGDIADFHGTGKSLDHKRVRCKSVFTS